MNFHNLTLIHRLKKLLDTDIMSSSDLMLFKQIRTVLILYSLDRHSDILLGEKKKKLDINL